MGIGPKTWLRVSAILGGAAVLLGAFGAHGLRGAVPPEIFSAYETGVTYHFFHALAIGVVAALGASGRFEAGALSVAAWLFVAGVVLFSGSLYGLAAGLSGVGPVTPVGGICFALGWGALFWVRPIGKADPERDADGDPAS